MESLDTLRLGVEAAIAFAGFSGIVATFQFGEAKKVRRSDAYGLTIILQFSLLAALISSIPLLLHSFGLSTTMLWAISSGVIAIIQTVAQYVQSKSAGHSVKNKQFLQVIVFIQCIGACMILMNVLNVLDVIFHREPGPIIATVLWTLCLAGFSFSRLLLLPVWRRARLQEAATPAIATSS